MCTRRENGPEWIWRDVFSGLESLHTGAVNTGQDIDRFAKEFDPQKRALREPSMEQLYSEKYHNDPTHNEMTR